MADEELYKVEWCATSGSLKVSTKDDKLLGYCQVDGTPLPSGHLTSSQTISADELLAYFMRCFAGELSRGRKLLFKLGESSDDYVTPLEHLTGRMITKCVASLNNKKNDTSRPEEERKKTQELLELFDSDIHLFLTHIAQSAPLYSLDEAANRPGLDEKSFWNVEDNRKKVLRLTEDELNTFFMDHPQLLPSLIDWAVKDILKYNPNIDSIQSIEDFDRTPSTGQQFLLFLAQNLTGLNLEGYLQHCSSQSSTQRHEMMADLIYLSLKHNVGSASSRPTFNVHPCSDEWRETFTKHFPERATITNNYFTSFQNMLNKQDNNEKDRLLLVLTERVHGSIDFNKLFRIYCSSAAINDDAHLMQKLKDLSDDERPPEESFLHTLAGNSGIISDLADGYDQSSPSYPDFPKYCIRKLFNVDDNQAESLLEMRDANGTSVRQILLAEGCLFVEDITGEKETDKNKKPSIKRKDAEIATALLKQKIADSRLDAASRLQALANLANIEWKSHFYVTSMPIGAGIKLGQFGKFLKGTQHVQTVMNWESVKWLEECVKKFSGWSWSDNNLKIRIENDKNKKRSCIISPSGRLEAIIEERKKTGETIRYEYTDDGYIKEAKIEKKGKPPIRINLEEGRYSTPEEALQDVSLVEKIGKNAEILQGAHIEMGDGNAPAEEVKPLKITADNFLTYVEVDKSDPDNVIWRLKDDIPFNRKVIFPEGEIITSEGETFPPPKTIISPPCAALKVPNSVDRVEFDNNNSEDRWNKLLNNPLNITGMSESVPFTIKLDPPPDFGKSLNDKEKIFRITANGPNDPSPIIIELGEHFPIEKLRLTGRTGDNKTKFKFVRKGGRELTPRQLDIISRNNPNATIVKPLEKKPTRQKT